MNGRRRTTRLPASYGSQIYQQTTTCLKIDFFQSFFEFFSRNFKMRGDRNHNDRHHDEQVWFYYIKLLICNRSPVCCHAISVDDRLTKKTSIIDCVYLEMRDLGRERCALRPLCAMSKISKLNRQIFMQKESLESQE
jgi:hypothetical protein